MIEIGHDIIINKGALKFKFSRSSGPGGQNVNKVNTKVTLLFDLASCKGFSEEQKSRIYKKLKSRTDNDGVIHVVSDRFRTQQGNKKAVASKLRTLLRSALKKDKPRKKTKVPNSSKIKRLEEKKHRSKTKSLRNKRISEEI